MFIEILAIYISWLNRANAVAFAGSHHMRFARACARFLADYARLYIRYRLWQWRKAEGYVHSDMMKLVSAFDRYYFQHEAK